MGGILDKILQNIKVVNPEEDAKTGHKEPTVPIVVGRGNGTSEETTENNKTHEAEIPKHLRGSISASLDNKTQAAPVVVHEEEPAAADTPVSPTQPSQQVASVPEGKSATTTPQAGTKKESINTSSYEVNYTPIGPSETILKAYDEQIKRHQENEQEEFASWKNALDEVTSQGKNLYKADPRLADIKRREGLWKTLAVTMGSIADTFAVANGGTVPLRDHRADVYSSYAKADAVDQSERAKETQAHQKYVDQLNAVLGRKPKHTQDAALLAKYKYLADVMKTNHIGYQAALQQYERLKAQKEMADDRNKTRLATAQTKAAGKGTIPKINYSDVSRPYINGMEFLLPKNFWNENAGLLSTEIQKALKESTDSTRQEKLAATMKELKEIMSGGGSRQAYETFISSYAKWLPESVIDLLEESRIKPREIKGVSEDTAQNYDKRWDEYLKRKTGQSKQQPASSATPTEQKKEPETNTSNTAKKQEPTIIRKY